MKKDIHPEYHTNAKVICACGNEFIVGSTVKEIHIEICSSCHPFYTGKQKLVDSARRVEKFQERIEKKAKASSARKGKKVKKQRERKVKVEKQEKKSLNKSRDKKDKKEKKEGK